MKKYISLIFLLINSFVSAQTVAELIDEMNTTSLDLFLNEFSGEVTTTVGGNTVTIDNRISNQNDLAAEYLKERLESFGNLTVVSNTYSTFGTNVIATQTGKTNPENIYIICGHYDSVTSYCADDNATGASAILEIARILSQYCTDNTIIYALWDEEEIGLNGSEEYATQANTDASNILGVINIDMIGYDANEDDNIPIHTKNVANSLALKDEVITILNDNSTAIGLSPTTVNPGIELSDHASFWSKNFTAIMISEAVGFSELNPNYHTANDRVSSLDLPYFYKVSKFLMAIMTTKAGLIKNEDCNIVNVKESDLLTGVELFPNPVSEELIVKLNNPNISNVSLQIVNTIGQLILQQNDIQLETIIDLSGLVKGVYYIKLQYRDEIITKSIAVY